jgi:hypothetical protein
MFIFHHDYIDDLNTYLDGGRIDLTININHIWLFNKLFYWKTTYLRFIVKLQS